MGSFVKGWIWIWLFSNTLSLGLSLLWELASRTYRQPTKGYTAGKVIPKADLWISRRTKLVLLFHKRLNVGFLTQDRPQCIYICDRMIYIMIANMMGPRDWKIDKWKCSVFYFRVENWEFFVKKLIQLHFFVHLYAYSSIIITIQPFLILYLL